MLLTQRLLIYTQSINTAYADVRLILAAHIEEMNQGMERYGAGYVKSMVDAIVEDTHDKHLYLALRQDNKISGNLDKWPETLPLKAGFMEISIDRPDENPPLHLLVNVLKYSRKKVELLVGYDLERVEILRNALSRGLIENMILAFVISLAISLLIIWLLNLYFSRFNSACDLVMAGHLTHRIKVYDTDDEFDRLAGNINRMLDWNAALITTVKDSGNAIAHDMRTPLSHLRLGLRALSDRPKLDAETRTVVAQQVEQVDALVEMFDNILNISKAESRSSTELFESVDIGRLVQDVLEFYEPIIEKKKLSLYTSMPTESLLMKGDKQLLGQAIVNLVDNACKYTPTGGRLDVQLEQKNNQILLTVADNGIGIPNELLGKVKERFFRVDTSRHTAGHGLGLSIVNAVAVLHQGELTLEDNAPGLKAILTLHKTV